MQLELPIYESQYTKLKHWITDSNMRAAAIYQPKITQHRFLVDKIITWGDATTEHIQIDTDGWFYLDGVKRKLIGMTDPMIYASGDPYDTGGGTTNYDILHTELDYLVSKGVRLYQVGLWRWYPASEYTNILQLFYDHKMLLVPVFTARGVGTGWDNFTTLDWTIDDNGTSMQYLTAWINAVKAFSNVVAISLNNELDLLGAYTYTLALATDYQALCVSTASALTTIPLLTKFTQIGLSSFGATVANALLTYSKIPCINLYYPTVADATALSKEAKNWYNYKTNCANHWVTETNYAVAFVYNATLLTVAMVDALFANNATAVFLYTVQDTSAAMFFDANGTKIANMDTLMANVDTWQAAC